MKKLIIIAAMLMSTVALAQTGVSTNAQLGTYLYTIHEKDDYVRRLIINYGDSADSMIQSFTVSDLEAFKVEEIEGQTIAENEMGYVIPLLATDSPFTRGQTVFLQVMPAYYFNNEEVKAIKPSEVIEAFLLGRPKAPRRIGIIRK